MAFDACMELTAVQSAIESADEILGGKVKASHTWLQKFDCLTQFLNDTDNIDNGQIIQVFIECLQPLKVRYNRTHTVIHKISINIFDAFFPPLELFGRFSIRNISLCVNHETCSVAVDKSTL